MNTFPTATKTVPALATLAFLLSGCAGLNPGTDAAVETVLDFRQHLAGGDTDQACALLAPKAVDAVEAGETGSCGRHLEALGLPSVATTSVTGSQAYGRSAQVQLADDTIFLTRSAASWKITAAGCTARGERPYDCQLAGQ